MEKCKYYNDDCTMWNHGLCFAQKETPPCFSNGNIEKCDMSDIKCPKCSASYYKECYSTSTAMYYPPIYKDGININPDGNIITQVCQCMNCGKIFSFQMRYGKILDNT